MDNKDGILIRNSLFENWISETISDCGFIQYIKQFETFKHQHLWPDLIWISDRKIYGIEHFYVDASKKNKKWNALKVEKSREIINNIIPNIQKKLITNKVASSSYKFKTSLSYEKLIENTYINFENHYKNINQYKGNIISDYGSDKNIEIIFYIEYNILPSVYMVNWKPERYFYPFHDVKFLEYFRDKNDIKWIIFSVNNQNHYIPIDKEYKVDNKYIFDFTNWEIEDFEMNQATIWIRTK